jgi:hypothetical protein
MFGATCAIFRNGARPKAPGARRGPQGTENWQETRGRIYDFNLPNLRTFVLAVSFEVPIFEAALWMTLKFCIFGNRSF